MNTNLLKKGYLVQEILSQRSSKMGLKIESKNMVSALRSFLKDQHLKREKSDKQIYEYFTDREGTAPRIFGEPSTPRGTVMTEAEEPCFSI